jgi:ribonuclease HI
MSKKLINKNPILEIFTDGAARGNPGPAAAAFLFVQDGNIILEESSFIGTSTNNSAEYQAIINALKAAEKYSKIEIQLFSDSNLVIQQINKRWKVNYPHLLKLRTEVYQLCKNYQKVEFCYISRGNRYIQKCDQLCNERLDAECV